MANGTESPCQTCRLYSGRGAPTEAVAATASRGATVPAGNTPTRRQVATRTSTGTFMYAGGSWGTLGRSTGSPLKNTS